LKKGVDIWVCGWYYSKALEGSGSERAQNQEADVPCKLNNVRNTAYANKHQKRVLEAVKNSFIILLRAKN
jgi:hypothetical protein